MQKIVTLCDIDQSEDDVRTYTILINGKGVDIDLCGRDAADLTRTVEVYMQAGRRPDAPRAARPAREPKTPAEPAPAAQPKTKRYNYKRGVFPCTECDLGKVFDTAAGLRMHKMRSEQHDHKGGTAGVKIVREPRMLPEKVKHGSTAILPKPLTCPVCGRTGYVTTAGLSSHLRQGHNTPESGQVAMRVAAETLAG